MSNQKAAQIADTQRSSTDNTEDRKKVEVLIDELLDTVMGGTLCQHCNQPCGDCVQPRES